MKNQLSEDGSMYNTYHFPDSDEAQSNDASQYDGYELYNSLGGTNLLRLSHFDNRSVVVDELVEMVKAMA
jgi:hypothetical protein